MEDVIKTEFVRVAELSMLDKMDAEYVRIAVNCLYSTLKDYSLEKIGKDIIVYDNANEKRIKEFGACLIIQGKSKNTIKQYVRELTRFYEFLGVDLVDVQTSQIRGYLATKLMNGAKKVTVNNSRNYISSFYRWMYSEGIVEKNPCEFVDTIKCEKEIKLPFSDVEIDLIRNNIHSLRDRAIVEVLLSSGIRINELTNLDISDIDMGNLTVKVRQGKGGKDRITYISRVTAHHLQSYLNTRTDNLQALFLNYDNRGDGFKDRISNSGVRKILSELGKTIGVNNIHPHRFRRTFATTLFHRGMNVVDIQALLGHSEINTTMTYIYCDGNNLKASYLKHAV